MHDGFQLERIPVFASFGAPQLELVSAAMERLSFGAGEDIIRQGAPADSLVILVAGQAVLFTTSPDGGQVAQAQLNPGQYINQEALFEEGVQSATLRATRETTILKLSGCRFHELLAAHPELSTALGIANSIENNPPIDPAFAEQREDEEILIQTQRHWWSYVRTAWLPLLLMPVMWIGALLVEVQIVSLGLLVLSVLAPGAALVYFYLEWRNDSVIVTDQRVIRINRTILTMYRQVTQVGLESIHEINFDIPSYDPFARLFRYGTVIVKTAGAQGNLELDFMPKPQRFQKLIIEDRQYFEDRQAQRHHKLVQAELERWMAGEASPEDAQSGPELDEPPRPIRGTNGYLSTRIEMSNGDIVYRKHASVWAQHIAIPLVIVLLSLFALFLTFTIMGPDLRLVAFPVSMAALLVGSLAYYWMDWDWRNDLYIIADDTITFVHKRPFFLQNIRDQILVERIDNVESVSSGVFAALLRYGDVSMSLVGADEPKLFRRVARPREVQQEISRRQHSKAERRARYDAIQQREIIGEYLGIAPSAQAPGSTASQTGAAVDSQAAAKHGRHSHGLSQSEFREAVNSDRNRPPHLPRKMLDRAQVPAPRSALADIDERRRPKRFRSDPKQGAPE